MASQIRCAAFAALILAAPVAAAAQPAHQHSHPAGEKLGTVAFQTSCSAAAQPLFNRAVALLHSFEFGDAIKGFTATLEADPSCAMAQWGIALSRWGNPFSVSQRAPAAIQAGAEAVAKGKALGPKTPREAGYLEAVGALFGNADTVDQRTRVVAYRDAMATLSAAHADDSEAAIFYALSLAAAALPTDKTYAEQLKAGAILERLIEARPEHPGLAHYIIHSYDVPALADRALIAARRYAKIAPSAPHALHMPSHTFTRVGAWQESIDTNTLSGDSARKLNSVGEELHAMDYRTYAYLQTGQDRAARAMVDALPEVLARYNPDAIGGAAPPSSGFFASASMPARYALERGDWAAAAALVAKPTRFFFPEAQTWFAKAIGAARGSKDAAAVKAAIAELTSLRDQLTQKKETYWAEQVDIQRRAATAWLAFAEGRGADALTELEAAAAMEDKTEKAATTPGPLAPAREQLGELLLELKKPAEALQAFETTLKKEPNRFRATAGAARAAKLAGDTTKAKQHAKALLAICAKADKPARPDLIEVGKLSSR
jgi:tetratricopeptide (TPR) repeat protein